MRKGSNRLKGNSVIRRFFRESLFYGRLSACNYRKHIFKEKDMGLEAKVFERKRPDFEKLRGFGFQKDKEGYHYSQLFMDGDFRADISISLEGNVFGRVFDTAAGEEYLPVHVAYQTGAFVNTVRARYVEILETIGAGCFTDRLFLFDQSERIAEMIRMRYGDRPDFPWKKYPGYGVFRNHENKKWYGIIVAIPKNKLDGRKDGAVIEVINVKIPPEKGKKFCGTEGIYPAWHMNKKSWVSLILDDTLPDGQIMEFLYESYRLTQKKKSGSKQDTAPHTWIIPANPYYYDIISAFRKTDVVEWKQAGHIEKGDTVYMYMAAPYSAILYRCEAVEVDIPCRKEDKKRERYCMRIRRNKTYDRSFCPLSEMRKRGVPGVRGLRTITAELKRYLDEAK